MQPSHNQNDHALNDDREKPLQTSNANSAVLGPRENSTPSDDSPSDHAPFYPHEPRSLDEVGVTKSEVATLIYKYLLARIEETGRGISSQVRLPFQLIEPLLHQAKHDRLVYFCAPAPLNDYVYRLTDTGRERALRETQHCTYSGAAPVTLEAYAESVRR